MTDLQRNPDVHPSVALVTGATSGIGRAVTMKLASDGFEVIVHGRDADRGAQTVEEIERSGGKARFLAADLGNPGEIRRLAEQAGDIDVLVNNAGHSAVRPARRHHAAQARGRARGDWGGRRIPVLTRASYVTGAVVAVDGGRTAI